MRVIVIYGPPAVGKLTVARELQAITGYKLMHNHLTLDLMNAIFDDADAQRELLRRIRLDVIQEAISINLNGLILTYAYQLEDGLEFLTNLVELIERDKGEVDFVQLTRSDKELERRITDESRHSFSKMRDVTKLRHTLTKHDQTEAVPFKNNLVVDTTHQTPIASARQIRGFFDLPTIKDR